MPDDCLFCRIASKDIPGDIVLETDAVVAFRDVNPQAPVHVLVIPREHHDDISGFGPDRAALLGELVGAANEVARREGVAESGFRLVANTGREGGQTVGHLHLHVLGGRVMGWPPG